MKMDNCDVFLDWMKERGETLLPWQAAIARTLLTMPTSSGKTWLLSRLIAFETVTTSQMFDDRVNLVDDRRDEQGRRRFTLGSVKGCPSMVPDEEGFWTPANDSE